MQASLAGARALVTGASGFIGSRRRLERRLRRYARRVGGERI